jgi:hypothetical protein
VRQIVEGSAFASNNDICKEGILAVHIGAPFNRSNDRHPDIGQVLENLNPSS